MRVTVRRSCGTSSNRSESCLYPQNKSGGVIRMAEKSAIQRIKDLDAERASIFDQAKEEALEKAKAAVAELNALGLNYTLSNGAGKQSKAASAKGKRTIKAAACPICEFQTAPPH